MKKSISILVLVIIVVAIILSIRQRAFDADSPARELELLSHAVVESPAFFLGVQNSPELLAHWEKVEGWDDMREAITQNALINEKITKAIAGMPEQAQRVANALIKKDTPALSIENLLLENFMAAVFYVDNVIWQKDSIPPMLVAISLRDTSAVKKALRQIASLKPITVAGKPALAADKMFIYADKRHVVFTSSQALLERFFATMDNPKALPSVLHNPRFRAIVPYGTAHDFSFFGDMSAYSFGKTPKTEEEKAHFEMFAKPWGIDAIKAFGGYSQSPDAHNSNLHAKILFEGKSLFYDLLASIHLEKNTLLADAPPDAVYAVALGMPDLSESLLTRIAHTTKNTATFVRYTESTEFKMLNGNLTRLNAAIRNFTPMDQGTPQILALADFKDLSKILTYPMLSAIFNLQGNPYVQVIAGAEVFSTQNRPFSLIKLNDHELAISTLPDSTEAVAILQEKSPTLAHNPVVAELYAKLGEGNFFEIFQDVKATYSAYAAVSGSTPAAYPTFASSYFAFVRDALTTGISATAMKAADNTIRIDGVYFMEFNLKSVAEKIRNIK